MTCKDRVKALVDSDDSRIASIKAKYKESIDDDNSKWLLVCQALDEQRATEPEELNDSSPISGVMIIKDEKPTISNAIKSIAPLVGELIVLDTGSTDGTYQYLQALKFANLQQVHIDPWDFSEARNYAQSMATRPHTLTLDGDEEFLGVSKIDTNKGDTGWICEEDFPNRAQAIIPRLFKTDTLRYKYEVHNQPIVPKGSVDFHLNGMIFHWPEMSQSKVKKRESRYANHKSGILKKPVKAFHDYDAFCQMSLGDKTDPEAFRRMWERGYVKFLNLDQKRQYAQRRFLLYPSIYSANSG